MFGRFLKAVLKAVRRAVYLWVVEPLWLAARQVVDAVVAFYLFALSITVLVVVGIVVGGAAGGGLGLVGIGPGSEKCAAFGAILGIIAGFYTPLFDRGRGVREYPRDPEHGLGPKRTGGSAG
jgi:hypothetical protein